MQAEKNTEKLMEFENLLGFAIVSIKLDYLKKMLG